jgi:5'-3' exonuclease
MLQTTEKLSSINLTPTVIIEIKDLKNTEFSIEEKIPLKIELHKENIIKNLFNVIAYIQERFGTALIFIKKDNMSYDLDLSIQLYLLSYKFQKTNIMIETNQEHVFKDIKESLNKILEIKKNFCSNNSELLKNNLIGMYSVLSPTIQKIVDNTYPTSFMGKKVIIIDNHNFFYRNYHGMPEMRDSKGRPTNVIKALTTLMKDIQEKEPDYVIFANEGTSIKNVRKDIFPSYKENRNPTPPDLKTQIPICLNLLNKMGITVVEKEGYEADDIICSYAESFSKEGASVIIMTTDKDLYQVLAERDSNISIFDPNKKEFITEQHCINKFGVTFNKCLMVQAIMGDTSDNIPGIKGIGVKTAAELINQYGNLDNLYKNVESIPGKKGEKIREGKEDAYKSLLLVSLFNDLSEKDIMIKSTMPKSPLNKILNDLASFEINV